jgi:hypothetical protein
VLMWGFMSAVVILALIMLIACFLKSPMATLLGIVAVVGIVGLIILLFWATDTDTAHMVGDFIKAKKGKYCPFVNVIRTRS